MRPARMRRWAAHPSVFAIVLAIVLATADIAMLPAIVRSDQLPSTLAGLAPFGLLGMASTPSILAGRGGIDLSVAPLMGFVNAIFVTRMIGTPLEAPWISGPLLILIGAAVGVLNGVVVAVLRFPAVIATLCTFFVLNGATLALVPTPVTAPANWTDALAGAIGPVPGAVLTIGVPLVLWFLLRRSAFGVTLLTVGDNDVAAYASGSRVVLVRILAFGLGGAIAGVAGLALTGLVRTADPGISGPYVLIALAAVALGGVSLGGGSGGLGGALAGACCVYALTMLLTTLHVPATWVNVAYGAVLLVALLANAALIARTRRTA